MTDSESDAFSLDISSVLLETENFTEEMIDLLQRAVIEKWSTEKLLDYIEDC